MVDAYLAFGGNIGPVGDRIFAAWKLLEDAPIITLVARSHLYRTAPVGGPPGQADYINAAARVRTALSARDLLSFCLGIERSLGRVRAERWGPRTLDIDLLLYGAGSGGAGVVRESGLSVPHPRLRERLFVLAPLLDVAPAQMKLPPDGATLSSVARAALAAAGESREDWARRRIAAAH